MKRFEATATVTPDGAMTVAVPETIRPGTYRVVVVVEEEAGGRDSSVREGPLNLPSWPWGAWPTDGTFRRQDIYGDDER